MTKFATCRSCHAELPRDAPGNRCPKCLLGLALEDPDDSDSTAPTSAMNFGDYELIEEISRGGMGVVFKARQRNLNRIVALKLILSGQFASKTEVLRFRSEAEAAANLRHAHIVAIHETGEHNGQHYFSMEYVDGRDLGVILRQGPVAAKRAARYAELIARAIHHAHEHGILHRDLKPSNILIDADDEPRITDFGLAKRLRSDFGFTVTGQTLGSPNYMPPEQTSGKSTALSPACDIYGIGAVLYHLLTGRPPFQAATIEETIRALHEQEAIAPRLLNPSIPRDLETICLKCLEKDPAKRHGHAGELADELGRFLRDEPIHSRPTGAAGKLWRWCRRKPVIAGLLTATALAIVTAVAGIGWQARARARDLVETRRLLYASDMSVGQQAYDAANTEMLRTLLTQHLPKAGEEDLRGFEWRLLWQWQHTDERSILFPHEGASVVSYSADGTLLAALNRDSGAHRILRVWRVADPRAPIFERTNVAGMVFSPNGTILAFSVRNEGLRLWDAAVRREVARFENIPTTPFVRFSADGSRLAVANRDGEVSIWRMPDGQKLSAKELGAARGLAMSPNARYVLSTGGQGVRLWDLVEDRVYEDISAGRLEELQSCAFVPNGQTLLIMSDHEVRAWNVENRTPEFTLMAENRCVNAAISRDGAKLSSCGWAGAYLWDLKSRTATPASRAHKNEVYGVDFAPDGNHVALATPRGVWVESLNANVTFDTVAAESPIKGLAFSPDDRFLAIGAQDELALRPIAAGPPRTLLPNHPRATYALAFSPDGRTLASGSDDNLLRLWDVTTGTNTVTLAGHSRWIRAAAYSPNGRWLATSQDADFDVRLWNAKGEFVQALQSPNQGGARALCFSPDGTRLAAGSRNGHVLIWNAQSWQPMTGHSEHARLNPASGTIHASVFLANGRTLATADNQGWIVFWDLQTRQTTRSWQAHSSGIRCLALSPDGCTLASAGYDQELTLWNVTTGRAMLRLKHSAPIFSVAFSHDGTLLASGGDDGIVRLWKAPAFKEIEAASRR